MERNSDLVKLVAYAPLIKREGQEQWKLEWSSNRADTILQVDHTDGEFGPFYWVVGSNKDTKQVFIKVANIRDTEQIVSINLKSLAANTEGVARVITGDCLDLENSNESTAVKTDESVFKLYSKSDFEYTFAAHSATVLILQIQ
ncbi:hypothetical protein BDB00DRAFT_873761 [Zychaea mexicana]|uniref:uncharacterized protein n=1 Tax=Zychaea mexicana TaxID=64656 RepID=UPI0022FF31B7|nr:uncharacterized protein BDB00DRAFT_873761 [Zychaea mexicana]KAI9492123.1 hypothetical protein BDB00DRAFT_873761 [Zychaea mexicana]